MMRLQYLWHIVGLLSQCFYTATPTPDVTNICGPQTDAGLVDRIQNSQWLASDWLLDQKTEDWGWDLRSTGSAILALQLANETWSRNQDSLESQLTVKQLEIEMLHKLSHKQTFKEMSAGDLAFYVMALQATCHDITDFYGHNLIHHLHHLVDNFNSNETDDNYFPFALGVLGLCSSGSDVPHSAITTLQEGQDQDGCYRYGVDVTSMAVMAMSCMQPTFNTATRLTIIRTMIRRGRSCILNNQREDGGFGNGDEINIITTALAAQALIASETNPAQWQCEAALDHILNAQHADGHFGEPEQRSPQGSTIQILPVLSNRNHGSLADSDRECPEEMLEGIPMIQSHHDVVNVTMEISQEDGQDGMEFFTFNPITIQAIRGESLFRVMERARQIDQLRFESRLTQFGNFINSINDIMIDKDNSYYWFLYEVDENGEEVAARTGADNIHPEDGDIFRYIYKAYVPH